MLLSDPKDGAAITWNVAAYGQREKRAVDGFTPVSKHFSLEVALTTVLTIHGAHGPPAQPMPMGAGREIQRVGRIPVQFQEDRIWLYDNQMLPTLCKALC